MDVSYVDRQSSGTTTSDMNPLVSPPPTTMPQHDSSPQQQPPLHPGGRPAGNVTVYQTTGPDAYTSPIAAPDGSTPALNPRSCVTCRRRKVRCDKQMPCSNCRRALIPCVFPAPGRAPRQPRPKDPNAPPKSSSHREVELIKRLRKLEGIVEELSGQIEIESGGKGVSSAGSPRSPDQATAPRRTSTKPPQGTGTCSDRAQGSASVLGEGDSLSEQGSEGSRKRDISSQLGRMVLNDHKGSTRYVSNGFWAKLNDELDALRQDTQRLTDDESEAESDYDETPEVSPPGGGIDGSDDDHHAFVFGYRSADVDLRSCHPIPSHSTYLWSVYKENVEPLVKILHVPTVEAIMLDARRDADKLSPGTEALVFAIYYSAVISLEADEVLANFNLTKDHVLKQYRFALEQSLARASFLQTSDLVVLQALSLFLIVVRRVDHSRFCWTLTCLVIRIAQGMGLHRDGSQFDLTPFETEMRRRVWWAILAIDLRSAEEVGTDLCITEASFDTQMPLNINDDDIRPTSTEIPVPCAGRSDSSVAVARYEILTLSRRFMTELADKTSDASSADREKILVDAYHRVEGRFLKYAIDESDPLYWIAAMVSRIIVAKMCLHIYQSKLFTGGQPELPDEVRDRIFVAAVEVVELGQKVNSDPRCHQYRWLFKTYTNWHAIAFNLIELCRRPWSALVERSWQAVATFERDPIDLAKSGNHSAVFLPLRKLYLRARRHRDAEVARLRNNLEEVRRLDWSDRMNPAMARFGPVPGDENRLERMRKDWWALVQPDSAYPQGQDIQAPLTGPLAGASESPTSQPATADNRGDAPGTNAFSKSDPSSTVQMAPPGQVDLTDEAMQMFSDMMAEPTPIISHFWPHMHMHEKGVVGPAAGGSNAATATQEQMDPATSLPGQSLGSLGPQVQAAASSRNDFPPFLWSNAWGQPALMPTAVDEGTGDLDMMEHDDFDWQNWGQTLQSFDMGGMRPPLV